MGVCEAMVTEGEGRERPDKSPTHEGDNRPVFVARGLTKVYGTAASPLFALRDIDLEIRQGEFLVLLGPSGLREINSAQYSWRNRCPDIGECKVA